MECVRSYFPNQGLNLSPLHWQLEVLTTGKPGRSQVCRSIEESPSEMSHPWYPCWLPANIQIRREGTLAKHMRLLSLASPSVIYRVPALCKASGTH